MKLVIVFFLLLSTPGASLVGNRKLQLGGRRPHTLSTSFRPSLAFTRGRAIGDRSAAWLPAVSDDSVEEDKTSFRFSLLLPVLAVAAAAAAANASPNLLETAGNAIDTARNINLQERLLEACSQVEDLGPIGKVYFAAVYIVLEVLALPAIPLTASAGYLFGATAGTVVVLFSATIAAGIAFLIGRTFLRQRIESMFEENKTFQAVDAAVAKEGFKVVFLLRLSPLLPFALSNYLYGLTSVEFWPYLGATLLGFTPGTFAYVYAGEAAKAISTSSDLPGNETLPWYAYAAAIAFLAALTQVIGQIATDAVARLEEEEA
mmetsp:Transcript_21592/g.48803  ORF Transcript_21592/g.48803 Transcript_21592/m.48803 type:complete len:318 (+) Transcript_21592:325-1278(+)|eukprot:CAMPEP_0172617420 /NCGR_PEP_ID=MMETSP1068-20121228/70242_1 /TAXON_ID=35684 /ORGANISM="Pseudopedinella elastica, Strain CCMP716" /LENGTH=317 /DNA_ID=CAMNT_0013423179 /DNA_START=321 /DNA_END=1274 /DNA_ORIENTATION=+